MSYHDTSNLLCELTSSDGACSNQTDLKKASRPISNDPYIYDDAGTIYDDAGKIYYDAGGTRPDIFDDAGTIYYDAGGTTPDEENYDDYLILQDEEDGYLNSEDLLVDRSSVIIQPKTAARQEHFRPDSTSTQISTGTEFRVLR